MADTLRVNPINCSGHGVCAELLPELIALDEWGYPLIDPHPVPPALDRRGPPRRGRVPRAGAEAPPLLTGRPRNAPGEAGPQDAAAKRSGGSAERRLR